MKKPPIGPREKSPPYHPTWFKVDLALDVNRCNWDQNGQMWIFTQVRRRSYICYKGVEHKTYWRTHWQQGRQDWVACEHEVN